VSVCRQQRRPARVWKAEPTVLPCCPLFAPCMWVPRRGVHALSVMPVRGYGRGLGD
jgi:hypothetical protein